MKFPHYENFININEAYSNFIPKLALVIDEIVPYKTEMMKGNSKEWCDSGVSEGINNRDKLSKKFKKSRLPLDQENYKNACYEFKKIIAEKERNYFDTKFTKNISKRKELWKTLKSLKLPKKVSIATINSFKDDKVVKFDLKSISKVFQTFFDNMAETLLQKLLFPQNTQGIDSVNKFYKDLDITTKFQSKLTTEEVVPNLLKALKFPRQQVLICSHLAKPVTKICNLSKISRIFPDPCKLAKLKPPFKESSEWTPPHQLQTYFVTIFSFKDI